jgi:uncharacterized protein YciI
LKYFVLEYEVVDDYAAKRMPYREEHLRLIRETHARGDLILAGAVGDPPDGALLVFRALSPAPAEEFARVDPYVINGLITRWRVRPWTVVVEPAAETWKPPAL